MDSPSVAVVILNWNGKKFLEQFLPSLVKSTYGNFTIVVADNASTDDSVSFLQEHYPQVRIIGNNGNLGYTGGYNAALQYVKADYYALLNSDVEVDPGWLDPLVNLMENDHMIGACQPKMLDFQHRNIFEYAGAAGGWLDAYGYPFCKGRIFDYCEEDQGQFDQSEPIFWASGAALFIRSGIFHEMKGFDPFSLPTWKKLTCAGECNWQDIKFIHAQNQSSIMLVVERFRKETSEKSSLISVTTWLCLARICAQEKNSGRSHIVFCLIR